jgi:hypothetical protein
MQDQAARLSAAVAVFKLRHGAAPAALASAPAAARTALPAARPAPAKRAAPAAKPARAGRPAAAVESDWEEF